MRNRSASGVESKSDVDVIELILGQAPVIAAKLDKIAVELSTRARVT